MTGRKYNLVTLFHHYMTLFSPSHRLHVAALHGRIVAWVLVLENITPAPQRVGLPNADNTLIPPQLHRPP